MGATWNDLIFDHYVVRSDGAKFKNGQRDDNADTSWLTIDGTRVALGPGTYDEMLVVPYVATDDEALSWFRWNAPMYDTTEMTAIVSEVEGNKAYISAIGHTPQEISQTVAEVYPGGTGKQSTIQQLADQLSFRVLAVDENTGDPVVAEIKLQATEGGSYVLVVADKTLVPGELVADHIKSGTLTLTGDMAIEGPGGGWRGTPSGIVVRDASNTDRLALGDISARAWGDNELDPGTYGFWGDRVGVFIRGYARLIRWGYAQDEDEIDISDEQNLVNPDVLVAPKEMLTYSPQQPQAVPHIYTEAVRDGDKFIIKAKTIIKGAETPLPTGTTSGDLRNGEWRQPQSAGPDGKKGVQTNFFKCRVNWTAGFLASIRVRQYVTNQFNANGDPINWDLKRSFSHQGPAFATHNGTLNWDISLENDVWAIRVEWDSTNPIVTNAFAGMAPGGAAYRSDVYLNNKGISVNPETPSDMSVMYILYDQG